MERYNVFIEPPKTYDIIFDELKVSDVLVRTLPKILRLDIKPHLLSILQPEITLYTEVFANISDELFATVKLESLSLDAYTQIDAGLTLKSADSDIINLTYTTATNNVNINSAIDTVVEMIMAPDEKLSVSGSVIVEQEAYTELDEGIYIEGDIASVKQAYTETNEQIGISSSDLFVASINTIALSELSAAISTSELDVVIT